MLLPRLPDALLIALDDRALHFALQPVHYLIRMAHVIAVAAFFGSIVLLDLRLAGIGAAAPLGPFARQAQPLLRGSLLVGLATGVALFLYDPVQVGSHAWFLPKLALIALALGNAALFRRSGYAPAVAGTGQSTRQPSRARIAGGVSLVLWLGVMAFACLDGEGRRRGCCCVEGCRPDAYFFEPLALNVSR